MANSEYPTRPITMVVPFSTGGTVGTSARIIQPHLQTILGVPLVVENKPGGAGLVGMDEFLSREKDGYTVFYTGIAQIVLNRLLHPETVPYELSDLVPIIGVTSDPRTFFVPIDSPYDTVEDLVKEIRQRPGELSLCYTAGTSGQWLAGWFKKELDLDVNLVGYPGGSPATSDLLGGHVDAYEDTGQGRVPFSDKIKAIGVAARESNENWPDAIPLLELDIFKKEGIDYIPYEETANNIVAWVHKDVLENYPERYYKLVSAFYELAKNPKYIEDAGELGIPPTLVWWSPSKVNEVMLNTVDVMEEDPKILELMIE